MCDMQERTLEELRIQSEGSHSLAVKQALINGLEVELVNTQKVLDSYDDVNNRLVDELAEATDQISAWMGKAAEIEGTGERKRYMATEAERQRIMGIVKAQANPSMINQFDLLDDIEKTTP